MPAKKKRYSIECKDDKTKQEFKKMCDINHIMNQQTRGILPDFNRNEGAYIDLTGVGDYQDAVDRVAKAESEWNRLPGKVKSEFNNDPANFVKFMDNLDTEAKYRKAEDLGLIKIREEITPLPDPPEPPRS